MTFSPTTADLKNILARNKPVKTTATNSTRQKLETELSTLQDKLSKNNQFNADRVKLEDQFNSVANKLNAINAPTPTAPVIDKTIPTYHIVAEDYYVAWSDKLGCLILSFRGHSKLEDPYSFINQLSRGGSWSNVRQGLNMSRLYTPVILTKVEFNNILATKPKWETLRKAYQWIVPFKYPTEYVDKFNITTPTVVL